MAFNPKIQELTEELFPIIGEFLKSQNEKGVEKVNLTDLNAFLEKRKIRDLPFIRSYPYSYQVDLVINNLVRTARLEEDGDLVWLSKYGRKTLSSK